MSRGRQKWTLSEGAGDAYTVDVKMPVDEQQCDYRNGGCANDRLRFQSVAQNLIRVFPRDTVMSPSFHYSRTREPYLGTGHAA